MNDIYLCTPCSTGLMAISWAHFDNTVRSTDVPDLDIFLCDHSLRVYEFLRGKSEAKADVMDHIPDEGYSKLSAVTTSL